MVSKETILKIKQKAKVGDCSPVDENSDKDLFLAADERLIKLLEEKSSSVRINLLDVDVEEPEEKEFEAAVRSTVTKLANITTLRSGVVQSEVVEFPQNTLTENETETFANEEIFKYINDEENKQNDSKLFD